MAKRMYSEVEMIGTLKQTQARRSAAEVDGRLEASNLIARTPVSPVLSVARLRHSL
jgi:hypothetical protein